MDTTDKTKSAISTSALSTPQIPFQLAQLPDLSNVYNSATNLGASVVQAGADSALASQKEQQALSNQMAESNAISSLTLQKGQQGNDLSAAYQKGGVNDLYKQLSGLNVEAQGLARESQAAPIQTQLESIGRGRTDAGIAPLDAAKRQDIALRSLELGQRAAIAQGNYDVAKNLADQQVNAKYAQIDAEIAARKINEEALYKNVTDPAIKKALEARMALTKKEEQAQAEKKAAETAVNNMLIEASPVAPPDVLQRAKDIQAKGGSALQVASALGKYGGDYYAREKIKSEIKKIDAESAKASADAAKTRSEANGSSVSGTVGATSNAKAWLDQYNSGALSLEDIYTKIGSSKEAGVLKNQVAQLVSAQGGKRKYGTDDASIQAINEQITNVNKLLNGDVGTIVGFVQGGLGVVPDSANVYKQDALAVAKNLVSNQTLQALADAKSKGVTFGALSEGELGLVGESASRIAAKLQKDKDGNITGFSGSEGEFIKDLKEVKKGLEKSIQGKTQSTQPNQSKADSVADDILKAKSNVTIQQSGINLFDN